MPGAELASTWPGNVLWAAEKNSAWKKSLFQFSVFEAASVLFGQLSPAAKFGRAAKFRRCSIPFSRIFATPGVNPCPVCPVLDIFHYSLLIKC